MAKYTTLKDVAMKAGTTASTVSYVLSNKSGRYISKETRAKVMDAVKELDYIKSNSAASLKGKGVKLIGILVPQFENQFFTRIIVASEKVFMAQGYDLVICDTLDNPSREKDFLRRMMEQRVDGLIITPTVEGTRNTLSLRRLGVPMVVVDRPLGSTENFHWVTTNNYRCGEVGAKYLHSKGHSHIAYIGWDTDVEDLLERKKAVFDVYGSSAVTVEVPISDEGGYEATRKILAEHPEVTAFFFGFNMQAKGGIQFLIDSGKIIGKTVSVALIGSPEWASAGNNDFAHVDMGDAELGSKAAQLLLDVIINGGTNQESIRIIQDCSLVEGTSVLEVKPSSMEVCK
jgi:LacI family transcriptional regulator